MTKLSQFSVKVANGSGILFQPLLEDCSYSYVLTAKHVVENNNPIEITNQGGEKMDVLESYLHEDKNKDAAIIKVKYLKGIESIYKIDIVTGKKNDCYLIGHPLSRRTTGNDSYRQDRVKEFFDKLKDGYIEAALDGAYTKGELDGQSGGGYFEVDHEKILLAGIQSKMAADDDKEQIGRIKFMPIAFFDEIIAKHSSKLNPIFPTDIQEMEPDSLLIYIKANKFIYYRRPQTKPIQFTTKSEQFSEKVNDILQRLLREDNLQGNDEYEILGISLFNRLFSDTEVAKDFRNLLESRDSVLKIVLYFDEASSALAVLPWEYLYIPKEETKDGYKEETKDGYFLGSKEKFILTRRLKSLAKSEPVTTTELRILIAVSKHLDKNDPANLEIDENLIEKEINSLNDSNGKKKEGKLPEKIF